MSANRFESIQQKFASVCFCRVSPQAPNSYACSLENLSLHSLLKRRHNLDAFSFFQVYRSLKSCPSLVQNISLPVPTRCVRNSSMFSACTSVRHSPFPRCAYASTWCVSTYIYFNSNHFNHFYLFSKSPCCLLYTLLFLISLFFLNNVEILVY
jgi:hypothetical protein